MDEVAPFPVFLVPRCRSFPSIGAVQSFRGGGLRHVRRCSLGVGRPVSLTAKQVQENERQDLTRSQRGWAYLTSSPKRDASRANRREIEIEDHVFPAQKINKLITMPAAISSCPEKVLPMNPGMSRRALVIFRRCSHKPGVEPCVHLDGSTRLFSTVIAKNHIPLRRMNFAI